MAARSLQGRLPEGEKNPSIKMDHVVRLSAAKSICGASLVAQWLGICLLMQETRVRALVWEDPTCRGAAGPVSHSC